MQPESTSLIITEDLQEITARENQLKIAALAGSEASQLFVALNQDRITLKNWGCVFRVPGIEGKIGALYLIAANRAKPPRIFLDDLNSMYAVIRILDGVNFTKEKPLQMIITDQGIMHMTLGNEAPSVIGMATEANATRPRYFTEHLPQTGSDVIVFTGTSAVKLSGSRESGWLGRTAQVFTYYRSPWQHRAVTKALPFTQAIHDSLPDLQFEVGGRAVDIRSQDALAFWNLQHKAVLTVGSFIYQNCLESTDNQIVLASPQREGYLRLQKPFSGGQLSVIKNIRGGQVVGEQPLEVLDTESGGIPVIFSADRVSLDGHEIFGCVLNTEQTLTAISHLAQAVACETE